MIPAAYFDGQSARLRQVVLGLSGGMLTVSGGDIVHAYPLADVHMDEPFTHAPCVLRFAGGARCEVADPHAKAMLAALLPYQPAPAERLRAHWYDVLLVLALLAAGLAAWLRQA